MAKLTKIKVDEEIYYFSELQIKILKCFNEVEQTISVKDLCLKLNVTEELIQNNLRIFEKWGLIKKC